MNITRIAPQTRTPRRSTPNARPPRSLPRHPLRPLVRTLALLTVATMTAACVSTEYTGESLPTDPQSHDIAVYEPGNRPERPAEPFGTIIVTEQAASRDAVRRALIRGARQRGADAILIQSIERFAYSDLADDAVTTDDDLDRIAPAIESKPRWRAEATLLRYLTHPQPPQPPNPNDRPPAPLSP